VFASLISILLLGPAMMGLPYLFKTAGIIPVVGFAFVTWICASLSGTILAETIEKIPGNKNFSKHIMFCNAFRLFLGNKWISLVESLYFIACFTQASAGLVETAHALDGFLSFFVLGKSYAFQFYPQPEFITWSPVTCTGTLLQPDVAHCLPFANNGPLVFTLGFALVTAILFPIGCYHLRETMVVQFVSFGFMIVLVAVFLAEFVHIGFQGHVPWVGSKFDNLVGLIMCNYSITLTIPSWLAEKTQTVSVNRTVWGATVLGSLLYLLFGIMCAMAFVDMPQDALSLLSSHQVNSIRHSHFKEARYSFCSARISYS